MKNRSSLFVLFVVAMFVVSACGGAAPQEQFISEAPAAEEPAVAAMPEPAMAPEMKAGEGEQSFDSIGFPVADSAAYEIANSAGDLTVLERSNRMIVKNADMRLMVEDTNVAIDRTTQIVGDSGGYIVSSRVWYQEYYTFQLKYASVTIGVPVDEFEKTLSRLRGLAVEVKDETASGDDVTDQYVDLQSQLTNLEATRERVKSFLEDAKTVDEALRINQELSNLDAQIEQIKGRMNYLNDRSAYSTITVTFEPQLPVIPVVEPTATPEPKPWTPADTLKPATETLTEAYQGIAEFLIWLFVVILPVMLPPMLIIWGLWKLMTRKPNKPSGS